MRFTFPFPFLGAGKASYYEHYAMTIKFCRTPTKEEVEQIIAIVPRGLSTDPYDFRGSLTTAWNDSYVQQAIQLYYGRKEDKRPDNRHELYWCSDHAIKAFEKAIIRWLMRVHSIVAIQLVFRPVDPGGDGIDFSPWHNWSVRAVLPLVKNWSDDFLKVAEADDPLFKDLLTGIVGYGSLPNDIVQKILKRYPGESG